MSGTERVLDLHLGGRRLAAAEHDVGGPLVIFCHGFRGERTGPHRTFVRAARALASCGVSSLRFDQYGSGDSAGDFLESRFDDWIETVVALVEQAAGRPVGLLGQSMGASAAICAAARTWVAATVAWVPDPELGPYAPHSSGAMEEGGQLVADAFWQQACAADVVGSLRRGSAPSYLVFGTADEYVSPDDRTALSAATGPADRVDVLEGWPHSAWTAAQADLVIGRSTAFLARHLL